MMTDHQTNLVSLLLGSFPTFQSGDGEAALGAYELVMRQHDARDLEPGVLILINGECPGHDGRFAPTAPQLATAIRMARDKRLRYESLQQKPALPAPDVQHDPESQARVRSMMEETLSGLGGSMRSPDAAEEEARRTAKEKAARHDAFFAEEFVPSGGGVGRISRSLAKKLGYGVGVPESDENAA